MQLITNPYKIKELMDEGHDIYYRHVNHPERELERWHGNPETADTLRYAFWYKEIKTSNEDLQNEETPVIMPTNIKYLDEEEYKEKVKRENEDYKELASMAVEFKGYTSEVKTDYFNGRRVIILKKSDTIIKIHEGNQIELFMGEYYESFPYTRDDARYIYNKAEHYLSENNKNQQNAKGEWEIINSICQNSKWVLKFESNREDNKRARYEKDGIILEIVEGEKIKVVCPGYFVDTYHYNIADAQIIVLKYNKQYVTMYIRKEKDERKLQQNRLGKKATKVKKKNDTEVILEFRNKNYGAFVLRVGRFGESTLIQNIDTLNSTLKKMYAGNKIDFIRATGVLLVYDTDVECKSLKLIDIGTAMNIHVLEDAEREIYNAIIEENKIFNGE